MAWETKSTTRDRIVLMRALTFAAATATGWALAWAALTIADRITTTRRTERLAFEAEVFLLLENAS